MTEKKTTQNSNENTVNDNSKLYAAASKEHIKQAELAKKTASEVENIVDLSKKLLEINKDMNSGSYANYKLAQDHAETITRQFASESNLTAAIQNKTNISKKLQDVHKHISDLNRQLLETTNNTNLSLKKKQQIMDSIGSALVEELKSRDETAESHYDAIEKENNIRSAIEERNAELMKSEKIQFGINAMFGAGAGTFGGLVKATKSFGAALKAAEKGSIMLAAFILVKEVIETILPILFAQNAEVTKLQKTLGVSGDEARRMRGEFVKFEASAHGAGSAFMTVKNQMEAIEKVSEALGASVDFSGEKAHKFLDNQIKLNKEFDLTGEDAANLQKTTTLLGMDAEQFATQAAKSQIALRNSTGVTASLKSIMTDVSKLSAATTLSLMKNPKALTDAVTKAKELGVSIDKMNNMADGLLNIESSISAQFEASVLTGKNLNFELAREKALRNDIAGAAADVLAQVGSAAEFGNMNRIQQEAIAKAAGMTKDELASSLITQQNLNKLGSAARADLEKRLVGLSAEEKAKVMANVQDDKSAVAAAKKIGGQEKINQMQEKFLSMVTNLLAPLEQIVDAFANIMEFLGPILGISVKIFSVFSPIMIIVRLISEIFKQFSKQISEALDPIMEMLGINGFGGVFDILGEIVDIYLKPFIELISLAAEIIVGSVLWTFKLVAGIVGGIIKMFKGDFIGGLKMIGQAVIDFLLFPIKMVLKYVDIVINSVADKINWLLSKLPGKKAIPTSNLAGSLESSTKLAAGGIVKARPGGTSAIIGEGGQDEAVLPLDKLSSILGGVLKMTPMGMLGSAIGGLFGGESEISKGETLIAEKIDSLILELRRKTFNANLDLKKVVKEGNEISQQKFVNA